MRVLHVTECLSSGVLTFVESITRRQADEGAEVSVLYTSRPDTPPREAIKGRLDPRVTVLPTVEGAGLTKLVRLWLAARKAAASGSYDVIHFHSSIAGAVGRAASFGGSPLLVYSPHGFAFLRTNRSSLNRIATKFVEALLAKRSLLLVTSQSEVDIAKRELRAPNVKYLASGVNPDEIPDQIPLKENPIPKVLMAGRLSFQKAPWRFAKVADQSAGKAEFIWVGGTPDEDGYKWVKGRNVKLVPWESPQALENLIDQSDIFLFLSLWEGMSLGLIQAQAHGLPAVVSNVVGNRDTVANGETGYVCDSYEQVYSAVTNLLTSPQLRNEMAQAAVRRVRKKFTDQNIGRDSLEQYHQFATAVGAVHLKLVPNE